MTRDLEITKALRARESSDGRWIFVTLTAPADLSDEAGHHCRKLLDTYFGSSTYYRVEVRGPNWHTHVLIYGRINEVKNILHHHWPEEWYKYCGTCYAEGFREDPKLFNLCLGKAVGYIRRHTGKFYHRNLTLASSN